MVDPPSSRSSFRFLVIDVFAERPLAGRATAVFPNATGLGPNAMQALALELGFPQTVFVLPPTPPEPEPRVRVFTPRAELPQAREFSIAAAYAIQHESSAAPTSEPDRLIMRDSTGPISVSMMSKVMTVKQSVPTLGEEYSDRAAVAALLSLTADDFEPVALQSGSETLPFMLVPVRDPRRLSDISFRKSIWDRTLGRSSSPHIMAFSVLENSPRSCRVKARAFLPALGVFEEPATERAAGPLVAYALKHRLLTPNRDAIVSILQGVEIERPSLIEVFVSHDDGDVTEIRIGGQCRSVAEGFISLPPAALRS